jgi:hypothetical protein
MTCFIHKLPATEVPWAYAIEFDFNQEMVDAIKAKIPSRARSWKPERRMWLFKADVIDDVCRLATLHCGRYVHVEPLEEETPNAPAYAYSMLHLLPSAPPAVVSAAYKALAKELHPDRGGSHARMQAINSAYALIKREYA